MNEKFIQNLDKLPADVRRQFVLLANQYGEKKKQKWLSIYILIIVHHGFPCFQYCICHIADFEDLYNYYNALTT